MQNIRGGDWGGGEANKGHCGRCAIHTVENNFHYTLIFTSSCKKQDGRMRKKGFIYPGIFLRFFAFLFLTSSCKASNLENERHFIVFFR